MTTYLQQEGAYIKTEKEESPHDLSFTFYCYRFKQYHKQHLSITQALSEAGKLERM